MNLVKVVLFTQYTWYLVMEAGKCIQLFLWNQKQFRFWPGIVHSSMHVSCVRGRPVIDCQVTRGPRGQHDWIYSLESKETRASSWQWSSLIVTQSSPRKTFRPVCYLNEFWDLISSQEHISRVWSLMFVTRNHLLGNQKSGTRFKYVCQEHVLRLFCEDMTTSWWRDIVVHTPGCHSSPFVL